MRFIGIAGIVIVASAALVVMVLWWNAAGSSRATPQASAPTQQAAPVPGQDPSRAMAHHWVDHQRVWADMERLPHEERVEALRRLHASLMSMDPAPQVASACGFFATRLYDHGLLRESIELYDRCARFSADPVQRVMALSVLGGILLYADASVTFREAEERLDELVGMIRAGQVSNLQNAHEGLLSDALFKLAFIAEARAQHERAARLTEEAIEAAGASLTGTRRLLRHMEAARRHGFAGNVERALDTVSRALAECPDCGIRPDPAAGIDQPGLRAAWLAERNLIAGYTPEDPRYSRHLEDIANDPRLNALPASLSILNTLGVSYIEQKRWAEAAALFERNAAVFAGLATDPAATSEQVRQYRDVLWLWARALRGKGDAPAAEAVLLSILERFPHSDQAECARDMLQSLRRGAG
jgi:tetratricopeptide (TPR) repeat protein